MPSNINEVAVQLKLWRKQKKYRFEPMPERLKLLIKELSSKYSKHKIISTLKITKPQLNSITAQDYSATNFSGSTPDTQEQFVPFKLVSPREDSQVCKIIRPDGSKLIIHSQDIHSVIKAFLCSS